MLSRHIETTTVVDAHSDKCVVTINLDHQPFIDQTRYLMCAYAVSIGADCKIVTETHAMIFNIINEFLNNYQRIILVDATCCINKRTPNLFELVHVDELGVVASIQSNTIESNHPLIPEKYISSGLLVISKQHQCLFTQDSPEKKHDIKQQLLDLRFCQPFVAQDPTPYKKVKKVLDPDYINQQYILHISNYYKHQLFYVSHICDIYNNRYYFTLNIRLDFNMIDDLTIEINRLKKIRKNKFKMLVFGMGYDSQLWYHVTEWKILFVECDQQLIDLHPQILSTQIIQYPYENINVMSSFTISDKTLDGFKVPNQLKNLTFDIILINGPNGSLDTHPGTLIPIYWSVKYLSHMGSVIYLCHSDRLLEKYCLDKYLTKQHYRIVSQFNEMYQSDKILRIK